MAIEKKKTMTQEGYDELVKELRWREGEERERIKNDIVTARGFGDLSENAEIHDASKAVQGVIDIGSTVKVYDETFGEEVIFRIVGSNEADVASGKISDLSPVGKSLIGHRAGDVVSGSVEASGFTFTYRVIDVTRD